LLRFIVGYVLQRSNDVSGTIWNAD
jgi:hypothetical protein